MPVTRKRLEKLIATLKERDSFRFDEPTPNRQYDSLDVYPATQGTFSPATSGSANSFLAWSANADTAFDTNGTLTRPLAMRWGGHWITLQLAFLVEANWVTRIETDAEPVRGFHESGTLVLVPNSEGLENDLKRMLTAFAAMRKRKVIALANPGWTQSAGWESVAEVGNHNPNRTAVFWHSQSHETAFDRSGRLVDHLYLHWRGDETQILEPLRHEGFELDAPPDENTAIIVRSGPCPDPAIELPPPEPESAATGPGTLLRGDGLTECLRFDADDPKPVASLAFSRHGPPRLVVELQSDRRGSPRRRPLVYELAHGRVIAELPSHSPYGSCGGLHFLPDGRLLYSLSDFPGGGQAVSLRVWREGSAEAPEFARYTMTHVSQRHLTAIDAGFKMIAVTTAQGIALRGIGAPDAPLPIVAAPAVRRVTIRKKNAPPPTVGPWDEFAKVGGERVDAYAMLAMSPDARHLLWTAGGSHEARMIERESGKVLWTANFFDTVGGRSTRGLLFSNSGEQFLATLAISKDLPQPDGRVDSITQWQTRVYRTADGQRAWPALEKALSGATCLSFHPLRSELAAGFDDGRVRLFAFPTDEELASVTVAGGVTAIAFDDRGAQLAVGTGKGELLLFVRE